MNTIDYCENEINKAVESGIIELLKPYDEMPIRLRVVTSRIIEDGGVQNHLNKHFTTDRLKDLINEFLK